MKSYFSCVARSDLRVAIHELLKELFFATQSEWLGSSFGRMQGATRHLSDLSTSYFDDMQFVGADHVPRCEMQLAYEHPTLCVLNFIAEGAIHFRRDGEERKVLRAPCAFWSLPGRLYHYGNVEGEVWNQMWVSAQGPRVTRMRETGLISDEPVTCQDMIGDSRFPTLMTELVESVMHHQSIAPMTHLWEALFLRILGARAAGERQRIVHADKLQALSIRMSESPTSVWNFEEEAEKLGISFAHFRRSFRRVVGRSPHDFWLDCQMRFAARLLRETERPAHQIAEEIGIESPHYFSRLFKQRMGLSPRSYRLGLVK